MTEGYPVSKLDEVLPWNWAKSLSIIKHVQWRDAYELARLLPG